MSASELPESSKFRWIHRTLVTVGVAIFIPLVYLGTAPFVVRAMLPSSNAAAGEGLYTRGFEIYFWPIEKVCDWWPWYEDWGASIVELD